MHILLSSSHSIARPFLSVPLTSKRQRTHAPVAVSCRATKVAGENHTTNFYEVLSLTPNNSSVDEIKKAYRTMALRYHPDLCPPPMKEESTRMFVQLNAAYRTLSDPVLRKEYDYELGLGNFGRRFKMGIVNDPATRSRWQQQIVELKRRSNCHMAEEEGSWGSRIRAQNTRKMENLFSS